MENGTIVESGNHQNLLLQKGKYFDLWSKQGLT
jgi:ATP-binding cassette subfamily B protein